MAVLKGSKHKEYVRYATHCLNMAASTNDQSHVASTAKWRLNGSNSLTLFCIH